MLMNKLVLHVSVAHLFVPTYRETHPHVMQAGWLALCRTYLYTFYHRFCKQQFLSVCSMLSA